MFPGLKANRPESLPEPITKAYNTKNPNFDSITQELRAKPLTNIAEVDVGKFYLAKMPWYGRDYREVIREMIEKAKEDPEIKRKIEQNEKEYQRQITEIENKYHIPYGQCLYGEKFDSIEKVREEFRNEKLFTKQDDLRWKLHFLMEESKDKENDVECLKISNQMKAEKEKLKASRGLTKVEDLFPYEHLRYISLFFIKVIDIKDDMIHCHGYDVKTGKIYAHLVEGSSGFHSDIDYFFFHFRDVDLFSVPGRGGAQPGGKRRSKTNGRFRKYRSRRNVSSRTQRRKKTQRRQRR